MTMVFLVRHAEHDLVGQVLVGRKQGVSLSAAGRERSERLGRWLQHERLTAVQSSPRERAVETAQPIARYAGLDLQVVEEADEIDFGAWTGRSIASLADDPAWQHWNCARGSARAPDGESAVAVQQRITGYLRGLLERLPDGRIVLVSHLDVIRSALLHLLDIPLHAFDRLEIAPGGISRVMLAGWGFRVVSVNETVLP